MLEVAIALAVTLIFSIGVSTAGARQEQRALYKTCLQLKEDIRETQEKAVLLGANYTLVFNATDPREGNYKIRKVLATIDRAVFFEQGVSYDTSKGKGTGFSTDDQMITFKPTGTLSQKGFTIFLKAGRYKQEMTIQPITGRVLIKKMTN